MDGDSVRKGTWLRRTYRSCVFCLVWMVLSVSSVARVNSPDSAWAAVYQCRDAAGKTVLTNRPLRLNNCRVLSEDTASASTPSVAIVTPQVSPPPMNSDVSSSSPFIPPLPPNRQSDAQGSAVGSIPAQTRGASLSPSPPQPCSRGLNPFNPLSTPPCAQPGQSGTNPPGAPLAPSQ